jgi:hypothetical protein
LSRHADDDEVIARTSHGSAVAGIVVIPDSEIYLDPLRALRVIASFRRTKTELRLVQRDSPALEGAPHRFRCDRIHLDPLSLPQAPRRRGTQRLTSTNRHLRWWDLAAVGRDKLTFDIPTLKKAFQQHFLGLATDYSDRMRSRLSFQTLMGRTETYNTR